MDSNIEICAIIVSRRTDKQIEDIVHLLQGCKIRYYYCSDIYTAAAKLAKIIDIERIIVIGTIEGLSQDDFSFPQFVLRNCGMPCYCLLSGLHNTNVKNILEAAKENIVVLTDINGIRKIVCCSTDGKQNFPNLKYTITQDEVKALLEVG